MWTACVFHLPFLLLNSNAWQFRLPAWVSLILRGCKPLSRASTDVGGSADSLDFDSHLLGTRKREEPRSVRSGDSQQVTSGRGTPLLGPKKLSNCQNTCSVVKGNRGGWWAGQSKAAVAKELTASAVRGCPMLRAAEHAHSAPGRLFLNASLRSLTSASARGLCSSWLGRSPPSVQAGPARGASGRATERQGACGPAAISTFTMTMSQGGLRACCYNQANL